MRLHDSLEHHARTHPSRFFGEFNDTRMSYAQANARANRLARALRSRGVGHGDRFAYLSKNSLDYCLIYFAAAKCGAIPVPLNYRLAAAEWQYIINDAAAKLVFAAADYRDDINTISGQLSTVECYITDGAVEQANWLGIEVLIAAESEQNLDADVSRDDQLFQMYTSGTTGNPKGVILSHRAICEGIKSTNDFIGLDSQDECALLVAPLYHISATMVLCALIGLGGSVVVLEDFIPQQTVATMSAGRVTTCMMVPAMIQACLVGVPEIDNVVFPKLRSLIYGASPISEETLRQAMRAFRCDFIQGYGMTETSGPVLGLTAEEHLMGLTDRPELLRSAGRAVGAAEIRIVADGRVLPCGEIGEIAVRSPQLMDGYWHLRDASAAAIVDGWMMTGDAAYMDEQGYVFIQDRIKDMVVSGGENIYPAEIENALFQHPGVADAAVIGIPDDRWGESVLAFVVQHEGQQIDEHSLSEFCHARLARYKVPDKYRFIGAIPRNPSGKALKQILREPYWAGMQRRVN